MSKNDVILLIEDDEFVAGVIVHILSRMSKHVLQARNGAEGAQLFAENESSITLVILDCGLPDVDGAALCRVFRRISATLPIILTSGWDSSDIARSLEQGPTVFLQKPFVPSELEDHVHTLLGAIT